MPADIEIKTSGLVHPLAGASTRPNTNTATAAPMSTAPIQSTGVAVSSREVAIVHVRMNIPTPAIVKATKIDCQDQKCSRIPVPKS